MGYIHPDKPDIIVSYAHVNDEPELENKPGWVTYLVRCLRRRLANKLGRDDSFELWSDKQLLGHVKLTPEIMGRLRDAAVLLLVMSPAYVASEWCRRELAEFQEEVRKRKKTRGRVFVVEFDQVDPSKRPPELSDLRGYRFWIEDPDSGNPHTLGYPIVRETDEHYHKRLNDLCIELVRELEALRQGEPAATASVTAPRPDARPAVYLAEVTEDLENRRDEIRRHLDQAGFQILPECILSLDDHEDYRVQVDAELAKAILFVQLLSETSGRRFKGTNTSYVAVQHQRAIAAGKRVLQWRRRGINIASNKIPDDHRQLLSGASVVADDFSVFKTLIIETIKILIDPTSAALDQLAPGDADEPVFILVEKTNPKALRAIAASFSEHGVATLQPIPGTWSRAIRTALKTRMLACDGMVLVHGDSPDWMVLQKTLFRNVET